jgi:hypothetical protein
MKIELNEAELLEIINALRERAHRCRDSTTAVIADQALAASPCRRWPPGAITCRRSPIRPSR